MGTNFITIEIFSDVPEAHISKGKLESEGIPCFLENESVISVNWLLSNAVGGVQLKVREKDVERAVKILRESK